MNKKEFQNFLALSFLSWLIPITGLAQLIPPAIPETDASANDQIQVSNTGNSVVNYMGYPLKVSVWDGHSPGLHYDYQNGLVTGEKELQTAFTTVEELPYDPDVVIGPMSDGHFIITYRWGSKIFIETWAFDGTTVNPVIPPTLISTGPGECWSPNIDQAYETGAIVWEQNGVIKGRTIDMGLFTLGPEVIFGDCLEGENKEPDVAVFSEGANRVAHVTFLNAFGGIHNLVYQRHNLTAFESGMPAPCTPPDLRILKSKPLGYWSAFQKPRIAATPHYVTPTHNWRDCQIVFTEFISPGNTRVSGFNHDHDVWGIDVFHEEEYSNSPSANLVSCSNINPVVSYTACQQIMIEWWYHPLGGGFCLPTTSEPVIGRQLDMSGLPLIDDYSMISVAIGEYYAPSVSGRYLSEGPFANSIFSTYAESALHDVRYKASDCSSPAMKTAPDATQEPSLTQAEIFPSPFSSDLNIRLTGMEETPPILVEITNANGQVLRSWNQAELEANQMDLRWDATAMPNGIYLIRVSGPGSITTYKAIRQD